MSSQSEKMEELHYWQVLSHVQFRVAVRKFGEAEPKMPDLQFEVRQGQHCQGTALRPHVIFLGVVPLARGQSVQFFFHAYLNPQNER